MTISLHRMLCSLSIVFHVSMCREPTCTDFQGTILDSGPGCGRSANKPGYSEVHPRILFGEDSALGEFPWMARLYYDTDEPTMALCGGSILFGYWVLSAAHCCDKRLLWVKVGEHTTSSPQDCDQNGCAPPAQLIGVESLIKHPGFSEEEMVEDICLIKLKQPVYFNRYVAPICLPVSCEIQQLDLTGQSLTAAGWGLSNNENQLASADTLQKVELPYLPKSECEEAANRSFHAGQMCVTQREHRQICQGDSGGPLMYEAAVNGPPRYYQLGVMSLTYPCNLTEEYPLGGVFADVSYYLPWIYEEVLRLTPNS